MSKRSEAGLVAAIVVPSVTSSCLIQLSNRSSVTAGATELSGVALWLIASASLAAASVILGMAMQPTAAGAGGVLVLGLGLGAILKPVGAPAPIAAVLAVTVCFVVMAAAASGFQNSTTTRGRALAIALWLLPACIVAGAMWSCLFCGCAPRCRVFPRLSASCAVASSGGAQVHVSTSCIS